MAYNKRNHNPPVFGWSDRGEGKACSCPVATKCGMKGKTGDSSSEDWTETERQEKEIEKERRKKKEERREQRAKKKKRAKSRKWR